MSAREFIVNRHVAILKEEMMCDHISVMYLPDDDIKILAKYPNMLLSFKDSGLTEEFNQYRVERLVELVKLRANGNHERLDYILENDLLFNNNPSKWKLILSICIYVFIGALLEIREEFYIVSICLLPTMLFLFTWMILMVTHMNLRVRDIVIRLTKYLK